MPPSGSPSPVHPCFGGIAFRAVFNIMASMITETAKLGLRQVLAVDQPRHCSCGDGRFSATCCGLEEKKRMEWIPKPEKPRRSPIRLAHLGWSPPELSKTDQGSQAIQHPNLANKIQTSTTKHTASCTKLLVSVHLRLKRALFWTSAGPRRLGRIVTTLHDPAARFCCPLSATWAI